MNLEKQFFEVAQLIQQARARTYQQINTELIELYWQIGQYIYHKTESGQWGKSVVEQLANYISRHYRDLRGYSDKNLWRMRQFYRTYKDHPKLSNLLRSISWSNNLAIFSRCKAMPEREFYLMMSVKEKYGFEELGRQISSGLYERVMIGNEKLSKPLREIAGITNLLKDKYVFEFLQLPKDYNESDLRKGLIEKIKNLILELGKDFAFIGQEYMVQVGSRDFEIDLLFYHRELQSLIAIEIKTETFKPSDLGQLEFYLEALDRDVKKAHEKPSIGILLCTDRDEEVVEYALNRSLSPTLVAEYQTRLPDKKFLKRKLTEIIRGNSAQEEK